MTPAELQLANQRLSLLQLAEALGNVSEACRQREVDRSQFYEWKRRYQLFGLQGLTNKNHPMSKPPDVVARILALSMEHPVWGCVRLSKELRLSGVLVSSPVVQRILIAHSLGRMEERARQLEERVLDSCIQATAEQKQAIEKFNPCYREQQIKTYTPGELLCQDHVIFGEFQKLGTLSLEAVVDTYSCFAFGFLYRAVRRKVSEENINYQRRMHPDVQILRYYVVPQYAIWNVTIHAILTNLKYPYDAGEYWPYQSYLARHSIEYRPNVAPNSRFNGLLHSFCNTVWYEFFCKHTHRRKYTTLRSLRIEFNEWLNHYNNTRIHPGYPNRGESPGNIVKRYLEQSSK